MTRRAFLAGIVAAPLSFESVARRPVSHAIRKITLRTQLDGLPELTARLRQLNLKYTRAWISTVRRPNGPTDHGCIGSRPQGGAG